MHSDSRTLESWARIVPVHVLEAVFDWIHYCFQCDFSNSVPRQTWRVIPGKLSILQVQNYVVNKKTKGG